MNKLNQLQNDYQEYIVNLDDYEIIQSIDHGSFGSVFKIKKKDADIYYAAKIIKIVNDSYFYKAVRREIDIMKNSKHPNIIGFVGLSFKDFENRDCIVLIMEYAEGGSLLNLLTKIRKNKKKTIRILNDTKKMKILIGIIRGMIYLQNNKIIHRDIKPGNILLDKDFHAKIADFGFSKYYQNEDDIYKSMQCGTDKYMPPEGSSDDDSIDKTFDVYSFGIIIYELLTGEEYVNNYLPLNFDRLKVQIKKEYRKIIERCLSQDPTERPSFKELFQKLAYNKKILNDEEEDDDDDEEDNNEEEQNNDENRTQYKYYLDNADPDEVYLYGRSIDHDYYEVTPQTINNLFNNHINPLCKAYNLQKKQIQSILNDIKKLQKGKVDSKKSSKPYKKPQKSSNNQISSQIAQLENKICKLTKQIQSSLKTNDEPSGDFLTNGEIESKILETQAENEQKFNEIQTAIDSINKQNASLIQANNSLIQKNEELTNHIQMILEEFNTVKNDNVNMKNEIIVLQNQIKELRANNQDTRYDKLIHENNKTMNHDQGKKNEIQIVSNDDDFFLSDLIQDCNDMKQSMIVDKTNPIYDKMKQLFLIDQMDSGKFFDITTTNNDSNFEQDCTDYEMHLSYQLINLLYENHLFESPEIKNNLLSFQNVIIDLEYPSQSFDTISTLIERLKEESQGKIKTCILVNNSNHKTDPKFQGNNKIDYLKIGTNIIEIEGNNKNGGSFSKCNSLMRVDISSSVTNIGMNAFSFCSKLSYIKIPNSVTSLGKDCFRKCESLVSISFPPKLKVIPESVLYGCSKLSVVEIPESVETIKSQAFTGCVSLKKISLPSSITNIETYAFCQCNSIQEIIIPPKVDKINNGVFSNCSMLKKVVISSHAVLIDESAFSNCKSLNTVDFSNCSKLNRIKKGAFSGCSELVNVIIPTCAKQVEYGAFPQTTKQTRAKNE